MGTITTGVGLISGINTADLIEQLLAVDARVKIPIQQKLAGLQASKTALLDINARLLNLKNAGEGLRTQTIFGAASASSTNEDVLTAVAGPTASPGSYSFIVKGLVATSQKLSQGFTDSGFTPLGLEQLSFEFGAGSLSGDADLAVLNGGAGVRRGPIQISDSAGGSAVVDLSTATTLREAVDAINDASGISVSAAIGADGLQVTDLAGGTGTLTIGNTSGSFTATDLGIAGSAVGGVLTGASINTLGSVSSLATLNNGNGVFIRNNVVDFRIAVGASTYDIDLGRTDAPIDTDTSLADLNNGSGVAINGTTDDDLSIVTSTGVTVGVDLGEIVEDGDVVADEVETVGELLQRVNGALADELGGGQVVMTINGDGSGFELVDSMGGANPLRVVGAGVNGSQTAEDLGIYTGASGGSGPTISGAVVPSTVDTPEAATIQDVITRINEQTGGAATASIASDGVSLRLTATGGEAISVAAGDPDGSSYGADIAEKTLQGLGLIGLSGTGSIQGGRVLAGLGTVLTSGLNGGAGLAGAGSLSITDRSGASFAMTGLEAYANVSELVQAINDEAAANLVDVAVSMNADGTGLQVSDTSGGGGNLVVTGTGATALGIESDVAASTVIGSNLQLRYLDEATLLSSLNGGNGVGTGQFTITDSTGASSTVDIGGDARTVYDVIREINSRGLEIEARINDDGDGIALIDTNAGPATAALSVSTLSGSVASALGLVGEAATPGGDLIGSLARTVDLDPSDSLEDVVSKINDAGIPVNAAILNSGTGATPFMLSLTSAISGSRGELVIDTGGADLGLTTLSEGRDAEVFFGSGDPQTALLLRSDSNQLDAAVPGLTIDLLSTSDDPVTVSVVRDTAAIVDAVKNLVTTFNDVIGRVNEYDSYNVETEERGPLLGDPTTARIRNSLYTLAQGKATGVDGAFTVLSQVGIRVGKEGELTFDEEKFLDAYEQDPAAVEELFVGFDKVTSTSEEISPGITVSTFDDTFTKVGFGDLFAQLVDSFTDTEFGAMTKADEGFQRLIDAANERIELIDERLEAKRLRLERQYAAMEAALAGLSEQQNALASIASLSGGA